jgi:cytochrome c-type biogenesis protein CcmF
VAVVGARRRLPELVDSGRHGVYAVAALVSLASIGLLYAFLTHDFSLKYVFDHSSREMPPELVVAAFYSGHQGSLLYWAWTLALLSAVVIFQNRQRHRQLMPYVIAVLMGIEAFFTLLLVFVTSPFVKLPSTPPNGLGLNPLLYDSGMLIHPPMLLAGYMSWSVPFAFAIAALATGRLGAEWIGATRRYALLAWTILGAGNLLGAWWAYHVLGWGGYWGWDPVENAAIMPWLTGTAYLHSVMIQERRGMLKLWNLGLLATTFTLCIFGTFIVRSGVISSVHAFAQSVVGPYYLAFLALIVLLSLGLLVWRGQALREEHALDSLLSREAAFLLNNLLFIGVVFAIFWGSIFPLITEVVQGVKLTVGPPYFNQVAGPILMALVALMGVGPLMPWRRSTPEHLARVLLPPLVFGAGVSAALGASGVREPVALLSFAIFAFVLGTIVSEFARGAKARHAATGEGYPRALLSLVRRNNRRYGGYVVHLGIVAIGVAAVASSFFQVERQASLRPGETLAIGSYRLTYQGLHERREPGVRVVEASVAVSQDGRLLGSVQPSKRHHDNFERQPQSGIVIRSTPVDDLYVVLVGWDEQGAASLLAFVNPLVWWLWAGGAVLLLGAWITMWPQPQPRLAAAPRPVREVAVGV